MKQKINLPQDAVRVALPGQFLAFDHVADEYDRTRAIPPALAEDVARLCLAEAKLTGHGLFIDAGAGTGRFAEPLERLAPGRIVGLDISAPMLAYARVKSPALALMQGDLQRLPFRDSAFQGALIVHILHLIDHWELVLYEVQRTLTPGGVLFLGRERGGRGALVNRYYEQARALGVLRQGKGREEQVIAHLRREGARVVRLSAPYLQWSRTVPVAETLDALARRTYSQTWPIPDDTHARLMANVREYALRNFGMNGEETTEAEFVLHHVHWPKLK